MDDPSQFDLSTFLEQEERFRKAWEQYEDQPAHGARPRGAPISEIVNPLASCCASLNRDRFLQLAQMEDQQYSDFSPLLILACKILETELAATLVDPARELGQDILLPLSTKKTGKKKPVLERWLQGRPTDLGTLDILLYTFRKGVEQDCPGFRNLIQAHFHEPYEALLRSKSLGKCLSCIRDQYRNPAAHGIDAFPREAYTQLTQLMLGASTVQQWLEEATLQPEPDEGVLHHHLQLRRQSGGGPPPSPAPWDRLVQFQCGNAFQAELKVDTQPGAVRTRSVQFQPSHRSNVFQIGSRICFQIQVSQPCYILLLNRAITGEVVLLMPNRDRQDHYVFDGVMHIPDPNLNEGNYPIGGPPGQEELLLIATSVPLDMEWDFTEPLKVLGTEDVSRLYAGIGKLKTDQVTIQAIQIEVVA